MLRWNWTAPTAVLALALGATGCEPDDAAPSIQGASASTAAEITADSSCRYFERCGVTVTTCSATTDGDDDCSTEVETVEYDACVEEADALLAEGFACAEFDEELVSLVDACLEAFETDACLDPASEVAMDFGMPRRCAYALDAVLRCTSGEDEATTPDGE
ncbi:MAG: hypothetical protein AAGA54_09520 [Myxococcota bacterium]